MKGQKLKLTLMKGQKLKLSLMKGQKLKLSLMNFFVVKPQILVQKLINLQSKKQS